jgi:RNA polymerase subunit RPABC4/transcription elongation factor Spt4
MADELNFEAPQSLKALRACLRCKLILPSQQFFQNGCPNCTDVFMQGDRQNVELHTAKNFSGCVGITNQRASWVARHIQVETGVQGMYAITVHGVEAEPAYEEDEDYENDEEEDDDVAYENN